MIVISVDPGQHAGWSIFSGQTFLGSGICGGDLDSAHSVHEVIKNNSPDIMVLEGQFIRKQRLKGLITLLERRCLWHILALIEGIPVTTVEPRTWQSHWELSVDMEINKRNDRTKEFKSRVISLANIISGKKLAENEADSFLLGAYWVDMEAVK